MKKLFLSLMSLLLVSIASAADANANLYVWFTNEKDDGGSPMAYYEDGPYLAKNEVYMLVFYSPADAAKLENPEEAPFSIDQCGNVVKIGESVAGELLYPVEFKLNETVASLYHRMENATGIPAKVRETSNRTSIPFVLDEISSRYYYLYWVVLDTRDANGVCADAAAGGSPLKYVSYYAASYCGVFTKMDDDDSSSGPVMPMNVGPVDVRVSICTTKSTFEDVPKRIDPYPIIPATPITSLTVDNGDGTTTTLTNEEGKLDAALSPTLTDIVFEDDGSVSFTVGELELDYVLYALEIATTLDNGGDWKTADQINVWVDRAGNVVAEDDEAKTEKKTLAEIFGKGYTRWRIEGEKDDRTITIPFIPGSASRFYRIVGEPGAAN